MRTMHGGDAALSIVRSGWLSHLGRIGPSLPLLTDGTPSMETTMQTKPFSPADPLDVLAIEAEARRMRAQAAADLVRGLGRWIAARLARAAGAVPAARGA